MLAFLSALKLSDWARKQGVSYITAWRWSKAGKLPVSERQLPTGTILVDEPSPEGHTVLYARVCSVDRRDDLERQMQRRQAFARKQGCTESDVVAETGPGLDGKRKELLRDPWTARSTVEHRDRLARFGMVEAALASSGKQIVVVEEGEVTDDLVRDLLEVLTSACEHLYGRRSARHRAKRVLEAMGCR